MYVALCSFYLFVEIIIIETKKIVHVFFVDRTSTTQQREKKCEWKTIRWMHFYSVWLFCLFHFVQSKIFKFVIPLYRHRQHFVVDCSPNFAGVVCVDRTHRRLFAQYLWFRLDRMDIPAKCVKNVISIEFVWSNNWLVTDITCPSESTCHAVRHGVHSKWPHGSIRMSLSFSAHILHNWNVLPAKQNQ